MAEAIGLALISAGASAAGSSGAVIAGYGIAGVSLSTIVGTTALVGGSLAVSALTAPGAPKVSPFQSVTKQAIPPRTRSVGFQKLGGYKAFEDVASDGSLVQLIVHGEGPWFRIRERWLNDVSITLAPDALSGTNTTRPWLNAIYIGTRLGTADQTVASEIAGRFSSWTADHRLRGLAYSVMVLQPAPKEKSKKVYPTGVPSLRVCAETALLPDPRDRTTIANPSAWTYSDNSARCILYYLIAVRGTDAVTSLPVPLGYGIALDRIDLDSFARFADLCDEPVALAAGGSEPRYRCWGTWDLTEEPRAVLRRMLDTCDGEIYTNPANGKIAIRGGRYEAPRITLHDGDIRSLQIVRGNDLMQAFNQLKVTYTSYPHDMQVVEGAPWNDLAAQAASGQVLAQDLDLRFVPSHTQARRLAKIAMAKGSPEFRLSTAAGRQGVWALGEPAVRIALDEYGGEIDGSYAVAQFTAAGDGSSASLELVSLGPDAYEWSVSEEGAPPPLPNEKNANTIPPVPQNLAVTFQRTTIGGSVTGLAARLTAEPTTLPNLTLVGQYRPVGGEGYGDMISTADGAAIIDNLSEQSYEFQARWDNGISESEWSETVTARPYADTVAPGPSTSMGASVSGGTVTVVSTAPSSENYGSTQLYRAPGFPAPFSAAIAIGAPVAGSPGGTISNIDPGVPSGPHSYWVRALNKSGFGDASSTYGILQVIV